jgi:outer membrane protein assembly factor BamB
MPTHGTSLWTFEASDEISGLDVAGDMVFVGSGSTVSGLDASTGTPRWRFHATLDGDSPLGNEVTLAAGTGAVFVATGSSVVALDATTGRHRWSTHMGHIPEYGVILGVRVAVTDDTVYATVANRVVALDPATGRPHWTHEVAQRFAGSPHSEAGRVFVTSGADIEALDQATGTLLWRYGNGNNDASHLTVSQGIVVKASHELGVVAVVAVDAASGEERWTATVGGRGAGLNWPPVVSHGVVLVLGRDGRLHALELATGACRWVLPDHATGGRPVDVAPAADGGVVYAATSGRIYAIDVATGATRWDHETFWDVFGISRIAARAGTVYLADLPNISGHVHALKAGENRILEPGGGYFRRLYESLLRHYHRDGAGRRRYLSDQQQAAADHLAELAPLRERKRMLSARSPWDEARRAMKRDLAPLRWELYALSRVSDYLIELSCPAGEPPAGFGVTGGHPVVEGSVTSRMERSGWRTSATPGWLGSRRLEAGGIATHTEFFSGIGLTPFEHGEAFSPFHHEIFAVVQDPSVANVTVEEVLWPGFWFGDLLFSRAGVRVRAPRHLIDAAVATTSTLYFTYRRHPRPTSDLSHGWGSKSQWATSFPLFYSDEEGLHLNWGGEVDIGTDPPISPAGRPDHDGRYPLDQRRELLLHRCFVRGPLPPHEDDRFPFEDRLSLTTAEWPLRPESIVHVPQIR